MRKKEIIGTFEKLGVFLGQFSNLPGRNLTVMPWLEELNKEFFQPMDVLVQNVYIHNPWFTGENVRYALKVAATWLRAESLVNWLSCYDNRPERVKEKTIAVVMAGNIPMVGFHDMLCVLVSGHRLLAKLSAKDDQLLKLISEIISAINGELGGKIVFEEGRLKDFDAVIATGSDNTARYFEYYFSKYPNIIRKNRSSAAIIDGLETKEDLERLADDVFRYFGLGCRSVSKLYVPADYDFSFLIEAFSKYSHIANHNQWANNYEYQRAVHLIDRIPHLDTGFLLIKESSNLSSPISVLHYENYDRPESVIDPDLTESDRIQCITARRPVDGKIIEFGKAQEPGLGDYADNIDTFEFLLNL
ncbi:MAG: acyl-CoA reductase [Marinilabiliales bacterium]|nr:MAG: acyl-CoA reductase [Marinilabiliales bacterium]